MSPWEIIALLKITKPYKTDYPVSRFLLASYYERAQQTPFCCIFHLCHALQDRVSESQLQAGKDPRLWLRCWLAAVGLRVTKSGTRLKSVEENNNHLNDYWNWTTRQNSITLTSDWI